MFCAMTALPIFYAKGGVASVQVSRTAKKVAVGSVVSWLQVSALSLTRCTDRQGCTGPHSFAWPGGALFRAE